MFCDQILVRSRLYQIADYKPRVNPPKNKSGPELLYLECSDLSPLWFNALDSRDRGLLDNRWSK